MKKLILATLVALSSTIAAAYPALGDKATFTGTITENGVAAPAKLTLEIVEVKGAQYKQLLTFERQGEAAQTQEKWMDGSEMANKELIAQLMKDCTTYGGKLETVTVPAGKFETCALPQDDQDSTSTSWVGDVPFATVKAVTQARAATGVSAEWVLNEYKAGN